MPSRSLVPLVLVLMVVAAAGVIGLLFITNPSLLRASPPPPSTTASTTSTTTSLVPVGDGSVDDLEAGCLLEGEDQPTGTIAAVPGRTGVVGSGALVRYMVEVEEGLRVDGECFARLVDEVLADERSWVGAGGLALQRVEAGPVDFRVSLLSPSTTDAECDPLETAGIYSCWSGERAAVNVWRWEHGTEEYADDLATYRQYVINHEVGHALQHGHVECTTPGEPAPVMQQQSKGLDGCTKNGFPLEEER